MGGSHLINSGLLGLPLSLEMNSITYFKQRLRISCHFKSEIWENYPPAALNSVGAVKHQYYFSISAQRAYARACAQPGRSKGKRASGPERYTRVKVHRQPRFDPWHHYSSLSLPQTNEEPRVSSEDSHFSPKLTNQIKHLSLTSRVGIPSAWFPVLVSIPLIRNLLLGSREIIHWLSCMKPTLNHIWFPKSMESDDPEYKVWNIPHVLPGVSHFSL